MPAEEIRLAQLLRPFPVKRLSDALYHVEADSGSIHAQVTALLIKSPTTPEAWRFELAALMDKLESLSGRCEDAWRKLDLMAGHADQDFERAVTAQACILKGLRGAAPEGEAA